MSLEVTLAKLGSYGRIRRKLPRSGHRVERAAKARGLIAPDIDR